MIGQMQPVTEDDCKSLGIDSYSDFLNVILPYSTDFKQLVMDR